MTEYGPKQTPPRPKDKNPAVLVECIYCKRRRWIGANEVPKGEVPMCDFDLGPMVAKSVEGRT